MPNHIYSKIKFGYNGENENRLNELKEYLKEGESIFSFNKIIPVPTGISHENPSLLSEEEYHWRCENWGTKWGAYNCEVTYDEHFSFEFTFKTAWAVPEPILKKLVDVLRDIEIQYVSVDEGGFFACHFEKEENSTEYTLSYIKDDQTINLLNLVMH